MHALRLGGTGRHFQSTLLAGRSARHGFGFGLAACRPFRISVLRPAPDRRPTHQARAPAACKRDFPYMYCLPRPRARTDMYFVMSVSLVNN